MPGMSRAERVKLAHETQRKAREARQAQGVTRVGPFTVRQVDDLNWSVEREGSEPRYYSTLPDALRALLAFYIGVIPKHGDDLRAVLEAVKQAEANILSALRTP